MAYAPLHTYKDQGDGTIQGFFRHRETGVAFEYSLSDQIILSPPAHGGRNREFCHRVWMSDGSYRYAQVMRTGVHIIVDETDHGWVVEYWPIHQHRQYPS